MSTHSGGGGRLFPLPARFLDLKNRSHKRDLLHKINSLSISVYILLFIKNLLGAKLAKLFQYPCQYINPTQWQASSQNMCSPFTPLSRLSIIKGAGTGTGQTLVLPRFSKSIKQRLPSNHFKGHTALLLKHRSGLAKIRFGAPAHDFANMDCQV